MQTSTCARFLIVSAMLSISWVAFGQTSDLYGVRVLGGNEIHVWRNGTIQRSWSISGGDEAPLGNTAIAVATQVRTLNYAPGRVGYEWTLQGVATGQTYPNPGLMLRDGTTDGVAFNYAVTETPYAVYRFDRNWANPMRLFDAGANGITFDPVTQSLWLGNDNQLENRRLDGSLISSFTFPSQGFGPYAGLAFDPADRTLWYADYGGAGRLLQFSTTGVQLNVLPLDQQDYWGLECAIPEPASGVLMLLATLGPWRRLRR